MIIPTLGMVLSLGYSLVAGSKNITSVKENFSERAEMLHSPVPTSVICTDSIPLVPLEPVLLDPTRESYIGKVKIGKLARLELRGKITYRLGRASALTKDIRTLTRMEGNHIRPTIVIKSLDGEQILNEIDYNAARGNKQYLTIENTDVRVFLRFDGIAFRVLGNDGANPLKAYLVECD